MKVKLNRKFWRAQPIAIPSIKAFALMSRLITLCLMHLTINHDVLDTIYGRMS